MNIDSAIARQHNFVDQIRLLDVKLPTIKGINLNPFPKEDWIVKQFLKKSISDSMNSFVINYDSGYYTSIDFYKREIESILPRVSKEVFFNFMTLSQSDLETIFKGSANSDRVILRSCRITTEDELDFSGPEYKTSYISLSHTGNSGLDNWISPWTKFRNIVKAMGKTSLRDSLQTFNVNG